MVQILVASGSQPIDAVQVRVSYDSTRLDIPGCEIAGGPALTEELEHRCDSATGLLRFAYGKLRPPFPSGTFTVATVTFRALAATQPGGTALSFVTTGATEAQKTQATYGGSVLPLTVANASVVIP